MTDKVQLIKQEIEREMRVLDLTNDFDNGRFSELNHLKLFIDSLPEEPASEDLEEAADKYAENHGFRVPYDGSNKFYDDVDVKASKEGFIAGAEWQKQKDQESVCEADCTTKDDDLEKEITKCYNRLMSFARKLSEIVGTPQSC